MLNILGIIPSRYASSRLPGKPLADIGGKTLIQRVYEQASKVDSLSEVIVATDDERIKKEVERFGGKAVMTATTHPSGTDRCFEALQKMPGEVDAVVNIQGDEPFILPVQIEAVCDLLKESTTELASLVRAFPNKQEVQDPNKVKVVFNKQMHALYFSRSPIPFDRTQGGPDYYQHIGIYGYKVDTLAQLVRSEPSSLEKAESLEQLRWLENGHFIKLGITSLESMGVDTPEDLERAREFARTFV